VPVQAAPAVPNESGWSSGKTPFEFMVVVTGTWSSSASSFSSPPGFGVEGRPWPAMMTGRWAVTSALAAASTSSGPAAERKLLGDTKGVYGRVVNLLAGDVHRRLPA